jgi:hypothetical protein
MARGVNIITVNNDSVLKKTGNEYFLKRKNNMVIKVRENIILTDKGINSFTPDK